MIFHNLKIGQAAKRYPVILTILLILPSRLSILFISAEIGFIDGRLYPFLSKFSFYEAKKIREIQMIFDE